MPCLWNSFKSIPGEAEGARGGWNPGLCSVSITDSELPGRSRYKSSKCWATWESRQGHGTRVTWFYSGEPWGQAGFSRDSLFRPFWNLPRKSHCKSVLFWDHLQCLALLCSQSISNCCMSDNVRLENTFVSTSQFAEIHSIFKVKQLARKLNVSVTLHLRREISL